MAQSVGQTLREARTEQGIELSEVERVTKIRVKFLQAMEEDRWEDLPGPPYTRGFLSSYARFLSLDEQALIERYRQTAAAAERAEAIPRTVIQPGTLKQHPSLRPAALVVAGLAAVVTLGLLAVSLGGSDSGGGKGERRAEKSSRKQSTGTGASSGAATTAPSTTTTATTGAEVSLELRATALVWVCVVDERDRLVVPGETLTTDETRGPFSGQGFEINLGNGSVEMTVDAQPVSVPAVAEPLGYRVTPDGVRRLSPSARPTCT